MAERQIVIEHHADERRYAVTLEDYRSKPIDDEGHTYQQLGFRIVRWEDGEPYKPPSELNRSRDDEPAERPARAEFDRPRRAEGGAVSSRTAATEMKEKSDG